MRQPAPPLTVQIHMNDDMTKPVLPVAGLVAEARRVRDQELGPGALPPLPMSDAKRRQLRALPLMLLISAACFASIIAVSAWVRPLVVAKSGWYGLLAVLHVGVAFGVNFWGWARVLHWFGLRCPYCGATFVFPGLKDPNKDPASAAEDERRCGSCQSVIIDLEA
jgi:hypothetical protein